MAASIKEVHFWGRGKWNFGRISFPRGKWPPYLNANVFLSNPENFQDSQNRKNPIKCENSIKTYKKILNKINFLNKQAGKTEYEIISHIFIRFANNFSPNKNPIERKIIQSFLVQQMLGKVLSYIYMGVERNENIPSFFIVNFILFSLLQYGCNQNNLISGRRKIGQVKICVLTFYCLIGKLSGAWNV